MGDEDSRADLVEQGSIGIRIDLEIYRADGGCHLTEILVERLRVTAELYTLEVIRPNAHAEAVEPQSFVKGRRNGCGLRAPSGIATAGLVNKVNRESFAQEDILEAFPSVGRGFPRLTELPYSVSEYQRIFSGIHGLLIEHVGIVTVVGVSQ